MGNNVIIERNKEGFLYAASEWHLEYTFKQQTV